MTTKNICTVDLNLNLKATRGDFQRESEMMADLRHPNIVCLLGVVSKDEPQCLIFEWMPHGDLHEYLLSHSPKSDLVNIVLNKNIFVNCKNILPNFISRLSLCLGLWTGRRSGSWITAT